MVWMPYGDSGSLAIHLEDSAIYAIAQIYASDFRPVDLDSDRSLSAASAFSDSSNTFLSVIVDDSDQVITYNPIITDMKPYNYDSEYNQQSMNLFHPTLAGVPGLVDHEAFQFPEADSAVAAAAGPSQIWIG